jgi:hypothetical protein
VTVAVQHLKEEPKPLRSLRADLPSEICDVVHRMMKKKPVERFQSPEELEAALGETEHNPCEYAAHE